MQLILIDHLKVLDCVMSQKFAFPRETLHLCAFVFAECFQSRKSHKTFALNEETSRSPEKLAKRDN